MGRGYSTDLRERVISAWQNRNLTYKELADLFGIGTATVDRWIRRYRESGNVEPLPHGGGAQRVLSDEQLGALERLVLEHPDWTEEDYTEHMAVEHGSNASRSSVGRAIRRLGYSVKKRPLPRRKEIALMSDDEEKNTS